MNPLLSHPVRLYQNSIRNAPVAQVPSLISAVSQGLDEAYKRINGNAAIDYHLFFWQDEKLIDYLFGGYDLSKKRSQAVLELRQKCSIFLGGIEKKLSKGKPFDFEAYLSASK
jgi:hypothetical protein